MVTSCSCGRFCITKAEKCTYECHCLPNCLCSKAHWNTRKLNLELIFYYFDLFNDFESFFLRMYIVLIEKNLEVSETGTTYSLL